MSEQSVKESVKKRYGGVALNVLSGEADSCCGAACLLHRGSDLGQPLRTRRDGGRPGRGAAWRRSAVATRPRWLSFPRAETVLDLGSGGGIDVLLSAKRVGPTGKAYGLDMTDEMLELARKNKEKSGMEECRVPERRDREYSAAGQLC